MASEEQVARLREQTGADAAACAKALEHSDGDLLDAFLYLEGRGQCFREGTGSFTTAPGESAEAAVKMALELPEKKKGRKGEKDDQWKDFLRELGRMGADLLRRSVVNQLSVWRKGRLVTSVPVLILVLLAIVAFWVTVPLLILGLVVGCRYQFVGPDLGNEKLGKVMDGVSSTVDDVVEQVKKGFRESGKKQ